METKEINFSIIGSGHIANKHRYFIDAHPQARFIAQVDTLLQGDPLGAFINSDTFTDVVCIATPNGLHAEHAIRLMKAGYHVVIEKPLSISKTSAEAIQSCAVACDKQVFVVMQNRYSPLAQWLKSMSSSGVLGKLFMVQINCFWNRDERYYQKDRWQGTLDLDGGTLYTQFSHFIDLMYWCFGDITAISGKLFSYNHRDLTEIEDSGYFQFSFVNGGSGQFNFSTSCYQKNLESTITILAENGTIKLGGQYMERVDHCEVKDYKLDIPEVAPQTGGPYRGNAANHRFVIDNVVETLNGRAAADTSVQQGLDVVAMIERIYQSLTPLSR